MYDIRVIMTSWTPSCYYEISFKKDFFRARLSITSWGKLTTCGQTSDSLGQASVDEYVLDYNEQPALWPDDASRIEEPLAVLYTL